MMSATMTATPERETDEEIARLRARVGEVATENDALRAERDGLRAERDGLRVREQDLLAQVERLKARVEDLSQRLYGRTSEKLGAEERKELEAAAEAIEADEAAEREEEAPRPAGATEAPDAEEASREERREEERKERKHGGRRPLPAHLPRERVEHHPPAEQLVCKECGCEKRPMREDVTEHLEVVQVCFRVIEDVRVTYSCPKCQGEVVSAEPPPTPVWRGRAGPGLLAQIATAKYGDHIPLARQSEIYARQGVDLSRSTLCDAVDDTADLVKGVAEKVKEEVLASPAIQTDDTHVRMLEPGKKGSKKAAMWVYRSCCGPNCQVFFEFTPNRKKEWPTAVLGKYEGYVQADAYKGYDGIFTRKEVHEVGCWAHARRKFRKAPKTSPLAAKALGLIGQLYAVEREAKGLTDEARAALRRDKARPILEELFRWAEAQARDTLPKSPLGEALTYALNQKDALCRYVEDGRLSIDNNPAERALRQVAVGRKNWLYTGSEEGGRRAAILYTLVGSCRELGVDPFEYLRDVIARVRTHPSSRISELTPAGWLRARSAAAAAESTSEAARA